LQKRKRETLVGEREDYELVNKLLHTQGGTSIPGPEVTTYSVDAAGRDMVSPPAKIVTADPD
jgi:hypothetical protein